MSSSSAASKQAKAANNAAEASLQATRETIEAQKEATKQAREDVEPWRKAGFQGLTLQRGLLGLRGASNPSPEDVMKLDPGYQFRLDEGRRSIDAASAAARGPGLSGATLKELERYGSDYASNEFANVYARAAGLSGMGLGAATGQANFSQAGAQAIGNATMAGTAAANEFRMQGANAAAAGTIGSGNAIGGAANNIGQMMLLKDILGSGGGAMGSNFAGI